ncbi:MAG: RHS repeat domain-containing protein [Thermoanaerobaculaceae bacterium]
MIGAALCCRGPGHAAAPGTSGTVTGFGSESYTYDPYGNLTSAGSIVLTTDPATNHLDAAVTGAAYDGAGNLTSFGLSGSTTTYTYDDLNQLASVSGSGINRSQAYTADGERLLVRDGPTYLVTLRDLGGNVIREYEYTTSGGWRWRRDNVYRGGLLLASQGREEGIQHYHLDHLGSPRLVTSRAGEQLRLFATSPFGKDPTATQSSERMRFTVHERDVGQLTDVLDDIDYMHARSYSPRLGRFTGIDPLKGDIREPQSLNLFSYVTNAPMSFLDPLGLLKADVTVTGRHPCPGASDGESCDEYDRRVVREFQLWALGQKLRQAGGSRQLVVVGAVGGGRWITEGEYRFLVTKAGDMFHGGRHVHVYLRRGGTLLGKVSRATGEVVEGSVPRAALRIGSRLGLWSAVGGVVLQAAPADAMTVTDAARQAFQNGEMSYEELVQTLEFYGELPRSASWPPAGASR